jgi:hypothetical protein
MSRVRVNQLSNLNNDGPIEFSSGLTIPVGANIGGDGTVLINSVGVVTAISFSGDGSDVTLPGFLTKASAISITFLSL